MNAEQIARRAENEEAAVRKALAVGGEQAADLARDAIDALRRRLGRKADLRKLAAMAVDYATRSLSTFRSRECFAQDVKRTNGAAAGLIARTAHDLAVAGKNDSARLDYLRLAKELFDAAAAC